MRYFQVGNRAQTVLYLTARFSISPAVYTSIKKNYQPREIAKKKNGTVSESGHWRF